jgi:hypothetical protein
LPLAIQIGRVIVAPARLPKPRPAGQAAAKPAPSPGKPETEVQQPMSTYSLITSKSLFNPNRSEALATTVAGGPPAPPPATPFLYGVIVRGDLSVAYLEDPASRRVAGYRIGDPIAGGVVQTIAGDHVVLKRGESTINVRLRDPSKPRPTEAPGAPGASALSGRQAVRRPVPFTPTPAPGAGTARRRIPAAPAVPTTPPGAAAVSPASPAAPESPPAHEAADDE